MQNLILMLKPLLPELIVAGGAILSLMLGVFTDGKRIRFMTKATVVLLIATLPVLFRQWDLNVLAMNGMLTIDKFGVMVKAILIVSTIFVLFLVHGIATPKSWVRFEIIPLMLLALLGMMLMVSSHTLLSLYMAMELMSLSLYILASMNRDSVLSSEAGLKYFVLGALASGLFLFGCAYIYGFSGSVDFTAIAARYPNSQSLSIGVLLGIVLVMIGLFFKVSAVPFHMWTPDVYQGSPTLITAFFAAAPKVAGMAILVRFLMQPLLGITPQWQQIVVVVSIASMALGAIAALRQSNIKRLLAYSSIGHVGYLLVGVAAGNITGIQSFLVYGSIYAIMTVGAFCAVMQLKRAGEVTEALDDFKGLSKREPMLAFIISVFMLSMAGIPPLAGFFAKFYVFYAAIEEELYALAVVGVLTSVIGAFYYLRVIKLMYFDDVANPIDEVVMPNAHRLLLGASFIFTLLYFIYPTPLIAVARAAARSLLG